MYMVWCPFYYETAIVPVSTDVQKCTYKKCFTLHYHGADKEFQEKNRMNSCILNAVKYSENC